MKVFKDPYQSSKEITKNVELIENFLLETERDIINQ
mgnify:CR=1 FL=1